MGQRDEGLDGLAQRRELDAAAAAKPATSGLPRLGAAKVEISLSDADGFRVKHGTDGTTLVHIEPQHVEHGDWSVLWNAIRSIEEKSAVRAGHVTL